MRRFSFLFSASLLACSKASSGAGGASATASSSTTSASVTGTSTSGSTSASTTSGQGGMGSFALTSSDLVAGGTFATNNTCHGTNVSPAFAWTPGPAGTASFAMVLTDKSNNLVHWVLWDIPASSISLPSGVEKTYQPANVSPAKQPLSYDNVTRGFLGPCPPSLHTYEFDLYALDAPSLSALGVTSTRADAVTEIQKHQIAKATLSGSST